MYSIIKGIVLEGQKILDPFCGAGTTGIAAIKHNCFFTGLDVDEKNVSISTGRLSEYDTEAQRYSLN
jgi:site-specific DNA-methyltransferase (adenine-specific)